MDSGSQLGHYTIPSALGKGGMGDAWRWRGRKLGREIAIKVLREQFPRDAVTLAGFQREAKLFAPPNDPKFAAVYGFEEDGGTALPCARIVGR
jgi:serine/threonine protein kinase